MSKADKLVLFNKEKNAEKVNLALKTIQCFKDNGTKLTVSELCKTTGLSYSFFYNNKTIREALCGSKVKDTNKTDELDIIRSLISAEYAGISLEDISNVMTSEDCSIKKAIDKIRYRAEKQGISHFGEKKIANNKQMMEIVVYRSYKDIDVKFEDGTIVCHKNYKLFQTGQISNPTHISKKHIGETMIAANKQKMTITGWRGYKDFDIEFEDGTKVVGKDYTNFTKGNVKNPNFQKINIYNVGCEKYAKNGIKIRIIRSNGSRDVDIEFEDGTIIPHKTTTNFSTGEVAYPTINNRGNGTFHNFSVTKAFKDGEKVYYHCKCQKCGLEEILTPQQMIKHHKECE